MWTCPRDESVYSDTENCCKICGYPKPIEEQPRSTSSTPFSNNLKSPAITYPRPGAKSDFMSTKELRERIRQLQMKANGLKAGVIISMLIILILFAVPYYVGYDTFTIFNNIAGYTGDPVYQVCSIVLLIFILLPTIFILMDLKVRQRNLPITISIISGIAATIYCCVIWFGNYEEANIVPFLIILGCFSSILFSVKYVRRLQELDNLMYRPRMIDTF